MTVLLLLKTLITISSVILLNHISYPLNNNVFMGQSITAQNDSIRRVPAFPGATGGGMFTTGGRGGKVIRVTNLNDSGPGSFRQAINTQGTRTIIFDVSGNIELNSRITIRHGNLTIAGQTAPGDGITIKGHQVRVAANNVIIRFIRFRLGDIAGQEYDALTVIGNRDIIIDHCSMSWGIDETATFYENENFTLQWSLISESLNNSIHQKGAHGYGGIWGGKNASFNYNILAHHYSRNPRLSGNRPEEEHTLDMEKAELVNNIIYNWVDRAIYGGENGNYNIIGNHFIPGPATTLTDETRVLILYAPYGRFFFQGNLLYVGKNRVELDWGDVYFDQDYFDKVVTRTPLEFNTRTQVLNPRRSIRDILNYAGASLVRDEIDQRIIREIKGRTYTYGQKGIIDSQTEVGGWPVIDTKLPKVDFDNDGIPDHWEKTNGLNPKSGSDGGSVSLHPYYTNLEVFLNSIVKNH